MSYRVYSDRVPDDFPPLPHPAICLIVAGSSATACIQDALARLNPDELGDFNLVQIFSWNRSRFTRPLFRVPDEESVVGFAVLRYALDSVTGARMLAGNRALYDENRRLGGPSIRSQPQSSPGVTGGFTTALIGTPWWRPRRAMTRIVCWHRGPICFCEGERVDGALAGSYWTVSSITTAAVPWERPRKLPSANVHTVVSLIRSLLSGRFLQIVVRRSIQQYPADMSASRFAFGTGCRRFLVLLTALVATSVSTACRAGPETPARAVSADTWAVVDGREITREHVDKAYRRTRDPSQTLSNEEELTAKLGLLNDLIVQEILLAKAGALKVEIADSEVDTAFAEAKKNIADEAFQQELTRRGLTAADMREGLRRELLTQKVINQEVGPKIAVTDREVTDFFAANRAQFNVAEESYHIAQIVVTPVRDAQVANRTGDDAATPQEAVAKVRRLMERLKAGASFRDLAVSYSEDPESAPRGGDLGFVPVSRLKQAPAPLRDAVLNKAPGTINVASVGGAHTLVLLVAHEAAGQRDLSMPGVRDGITATLRGRKEQLFRAAYITALRNDAEVVNYLARRLVESNGTLPGLPLAAPGTK